MDLENVLFNKDNFKFTRINQNHYIIEFTIENNNIELPKIIDFNLIKLIYDLNNDIFEKVCLEKINDNQANVVLLLKHFFEDIGIPQYFCYLNINKVIEEKCILFRTHSVKNIIPEGMPIETEFMNICNVTTKCDIITQHKLNFSHTVIFDSSITFPLFVEKTIGLILNKIFKRVKQFIEKV